MLLKSCLSCSRFSLFTDEDGDLFIHEACPDLN